MRKFSRITRGGIYFGVESLVRYSHACGLLKCQLIWLIGVSSGAQITRNPLKQVITWVTVPDTPSGCSNFKSFHCFRRSSWDSGHILHSSVILRNLVPKRSTAATLPLLPLYNAKHLRSFVHNNLFDVIVFGFEKRIFLLRLSMFWKLFLFIQDGIWENKVRNGEKFPLRLHIAVEQTPHRQWVMCTLQFREREWFILESWLGSLR